MTDLPISWQFNALHSTSEPPNSFHQESWCQVLEKQLTKEWTLICGWSCLQRQEVHQGRQRHFNSYSGRELSQRLRSGIPDFIEVRRNSTDGEFILAGTVNISLKGQSQSVLEKRFIQLLEDGYLSTKLELTPCHETEFETVTMTGHITVSESPNKFTMDLVDMGCTKDDNLESLLELSDDLLPLLDQNESSFSDVSLKCGQTIIPAHKSILSARSSVFAAMFKSQMKESQENRVTITDIDVPVLRDMLAYMYTGRSGDLTITSAANLLFAADKYQLQGLKKVCRNYLQCNISMTNAVSLLVLGELHDQKLKDYAVNFICNKCEVFSDFQKTVEWKELQKERPGLAIEVLSSLVQIQEVKLKRCN